MKKAISMMLATAMAATCLAGCGSAASSSAAAPSEAASSEATSAATSEASTGEKTFENNELNIAVFEGGYGSAYWDEIIKRFEDAYPGVTVNMQISPKIGDIIRPQIVAGNVPDFISMNDNDSTGLISSMVKEHALMDLSDVFEEGGIDDDTPLKDQVIDGLLDSAKCSPYGDGKIYIAPFDASPMGLVYNKTLFEENGWETPVTWDDFFELGDKAKEKGIALFTYQGIYPGYLESMLWPALASATGIDNMKAIASYTPGSLSSDEALKVFQNMAKIGTDGYLMDGTVALNHTQSQTDMMMNKALFIPNGNWMEGEMADAPRADGFEFGLTCAPVLDDGETRYVMSSVEQFEIPANAKNPELAKEFLRFLYTEDSVKLFAEKANGIYMAAIFIQATYIMIPLFLQMNKLNLLNSLTALGVLYATMQFPFAIFLLTGFLRSIPRDYEEAAMIDGCGPFRILTSIIIPMCKPGIVTVCMISAMAAWNEYPVALVMVTDPTKATLPVGLANLYEIQRYATDWGALFAALVLALIPTVILFIVGQKQLVQGLSVGGVKG